MARRLTQTAFDYVVIALSPALIMTLVGSLVFFLLAVFYQGNFNVRVHWVMACFVFAEVLIGRISIEEGWERAMPFGIALAIVVSVAVNQFMQVQGTWVDNFSWVINNGLIALIWWCAHRLTWDCTVIDDAEDASGEGLLQIAGLESRLSEAIAETANGKQAVGPGGTTAFDRAVEGTTSRQVPKGFWQRYVEHQHRPHAPGVWVVYFSLAALPLFGIGQWFIPETNVVGRLAAFWLLAIYVASGLGLLLTTSFLGLRRYLRQRRIEMPVTMANLWLSIGTSLIVLLLAFAALLPRPSAEYAISQLPFSLGSPDQRASKMSPTSQEGAEGEQSGSARDTRTEDERETAGEQQQQPSDSGQRADADAKTGPGGTKPQADQTGSARDVSASKSASSTDSKGQSKGGSSKRQDPSQKSDSPTKSSQEQHDSQDQSDQKSDGAQNAEPPNDSQLQQTSSQDAASPRTAEQAGKPAESTSQSAEAAAQDAATSQPDSPSFEPSLPTPELGPVAQLLQWVFYGVVILGAAYGLWRFRAELIQAIRDILAAFGDLFAGLFGGRRAPRAAADERMQAIEFPPAPFASFADPFAARLAEQFSREELVRYSFEAFEAWSREHGSVRKPDITPHELVRDVAKRNPHIAADARTLAELYARAAYADGRVPPDAVDALRHLWQTMRAATPATC